MSGPVPLSSPVWHLTLIQTKMTPPSPPRRQVARLALCQRLEQALERRVTVVTAPAGFGKTTLLRQWCEELRARQHVVGWLSVDTEDNDLQQFGAYLLGCLRLGGVGGQAEALLRDDPMTPVNAIVSVLLNEIAADPRQVFLVLDDFDRLTSQTIRALVLRLLRYAPANFHLLMGVRHDQGLNLGELRAQDQLLNIGVDELRFTVEDARRFLCQTRGVALDPSSVQMLHDATEGWVVGLQLASLALEQSVDAAQVAHDITSNRYGIDAYLESTVLAQMPPAMKQFALRTSILERLGPEVCDAVMAEHGSSWEKLEWLEQHNLFLRALDEERRWYRYHALMAAALRRRAERSLATELPQLHRRAGAWFAEQQLWPEAVRHALACGDMAQAAGWVEAAAMALIGRSDVRTVLGWLAKLPPEIVQERRRLRLARIWAQLLSLRGRETTEAAALLAQEVTQQQALGHTSAADTSLLAEINAARALNAGLMDDSHTSMELGRLAHAQAQASSTAPGWVRRFAEAALAFGLPYAGRFDEVRQLRQTERRDLDSEVSLYADVYCTSMFGLSALVQGEIDEAAAIFEAALSKAEGMVGRYAAAAVLPAGYLAQIYYERNDMVRVEQVIAGRTAIAIQACALGSLQRYCRTCARWFARRGDLAWALTILDEGRELAGVRQWLRLRASCDAEAVRLHLLHGDLEQAQRVVDELSAAMPTTEPSPIGSFLETYASHAFAQARLAMAQGRAGQAVERLTEVQSRLHAAGMAYLHAIASMLLALALDQRGSQTEAFSALDQALAYAQAQGMVGSFIDEGAVMVGLLRARQSYTARPLEPVGSIVGQLLELLDTNHRPDTALTPAVQPHTGTASPLLSGREIEVLGHIAQGLSNKEIARALQVAPETVKWHLKNIFEKLNVGSRVEAAQVGLGLLRLLPGHTTEATGVAPPTKGRRTA
ncbi:MULTISPECIES: LuxR C-terminal-related transcriptional regulator [Giesbergeria]|uniref:LuxR C-terminal-related transcriptional regulator n=1 Tax=Giesbergeria sinuosa TaxID=80883 RepID=A0ABV9QGF5_9BURK